MSSRGANLSKRTRWTCRISTSRLECYRKGMGTPTLLRFEQFEQLPDEPGKLEFLEGELIQLPPAKFNHMEIAHRIYALLKYGVDKAEASARLGGASLERANKSGTGAGPQQRENGPTPT